MIHHFTLKSIYIPDLDINIPISPWHQHVHTWPTLWYTYVTLSLIYIADLEINIQIWPWHQYTYLIFNLHFHFNINIHTLPWHQYTNPTLTSTYIHDLDINIQTWPWHQYTHLTLTSIKCFITLISIYIPEVNAFTEVTHPAESLVQSFLTNTSLVHGGTVIQVMNV